MHRAMGRFRASPTVIGDFLGAVARGDVQLEDTSPVRYLTGFANPAGPYEISGKRRLDFSLKQLAAHGLTSNREPPYNLDVAKLWHDYGDMLPHQHMLLALAGYDDHGSDVSVVLEVCAGERARPAQVEFATYFNMGEGWVYASLATRIEGGETSIVHSNQHIVRDFDPDPRMGVQGIGMSALFYTLFLLRHQAIEYEMGGLSDGHRRYNSQHSRAQPVIPKPHIWDLSKPKTERIPVVQPPAPEAKGTGPKKRPHDHPGSVAIMKKSGKTRIQPPYKVHGGAKEPRLTIVKLPKDPSEE